MALASGGTLLLISGVFGLLSPAHGLWGLPAWTRVVLAGRTIAGQVVMPFITQGYEALDINAHKDWWYAEHLLAQGEVRLPQVAQPPFAA